MYEGAIEAQPPHALTDADTRTLCTRYAALERRLGEIDRARAILIHAASLADPRADKDFWAEWNAFEVKHGNEDTFRCAARSQGGAARRGAGQEGHAKRGATARLQLGLALKLEDWVGTAGRGGWRLFLSGPVSVGTWQLWACCGIGHPPGWPAVLLACTLATLRAPSNPPAPPFREMLRIKRSVAAAFSQAHFNTTIIDAAAMRAEGVGAPTLASGVPGDKRKREEGVDDMAALEAAVAGGAAAPAAPALEPGTRVKGFVSAGVIQQGNDGGEAAGAGAAAPANPEELELAEEGDEEGGGGDEGNEVQLEEQAVPDAVFGSLAKKPRTEG